ncbi:MAG: Druantia anti-phage system protein DruA [Bacteroidota bacterium]|nr:Druantia anti-phage system protein DruA [Bacteroidota bacterium]
MIKKIPYNPTFTFPENKDLFEKYFKKISRSIKKENRVEFLVSCKKELIITNDLSDASLELMFTKSLTLDLLLVNWNYKNGFMFFSDDKPSKQIVMSKQNIERDAFMAKETIQNFVSKLHRKKYYKDKWVSIFSLYRDGQQMAKELNNINRRTKNEKQRILQLKKIIQPYVQVVNEKDKCEFTGLRLLDIWKYFRLNWTSVSKPIPGRSMKFLVRDAAVENHPVIGVFELNSAMAQLSVREKLIGWNNEKIIEYIIANPNKKTSNWLFRMFNKQFDAIKIDDLIDNKLISKSNIEKPNDVIIQRLRVLSLEAKEKHIMNPGEIKKLLASDSIDWENVSTTNLYLSKRLNRLQLLLSIKKDCDSFFNNNLDASSINDLCKQNRFKNAIGKLIRLHKGSLVGNEIADISTCGSVQGPYSLLLGGKLVSMLLCSPEIINEYKNRYASRATKIASGMKGCAIYPKCNLVFLGTTSLYGDNASQYNRIKIPSSIFSNRRKNNCIKYIRIGKTEGFGSFHLSTTTKLLSDIYLTRLNLRKVNSIFGEGANPRLRALRASLDKLHLDAAQILNHKNPRIIYAIPLAVNYRDYLLGLEKVPKYPFSLKNGKKITKLISDYWISRWLSMRTKNQSIIDKVSKHDIYYPINHISRVVIKEKTNQTSLEF